jgi:sigma-B regulation protein RsbU (phosphoserine phosphatase)
VKPTVILLVEDNPGDARLIEEFLSETGFAHEFVWAKELAAATERVRSVAVDIVLLDLSLPDSNGFDTFARFSKITSLPIIVLTGLNNSELGVRTVQAGAQDYLVKGQVDGPLLVRAIQYAIERKRAGDELARYAEEISRKNAQMVEDLKIAREIQLAFFPDRYPCFPPRALPGASTVEFHCCYRPATALGGDYFEILPVADYKAGVLICDVMGHGVRAALVTAYLRGLLEQLLALAGDPGSLMTEVNRGLLGIFRRTDSGMFASACYILVDAEAGEVRYSIAGHPPPLCVRPGDERVDLLDRADESNPCLALGIVEEVEYETFRAPLAAGDMILLYTDGVYELESPEGQQYGEERLQDALRARVHLPMDELMDGLCAEVGHFAGDREFADDFSLVGVRLVRLKAGAAAEISLTGSLRAAQ